MSKTTYQTDENKPICLIEKKLTREEWFSSYRKGIDGCFDDIRWQDAYNPGYWWVDELNNIRIYFMGWDRLNGADRGLYTPVYVAIVDWGDKTFRFYSNIFKIPEWTEVYGQPQNTCWMVFRIELVSGWDDDLEDLVTVKQTITDVVVNIKHTIPLSHIKKAEVRFVDHRFESRPVELIG